MFTTVDIELPLAHVGAVNAWLLRGTPLTLVDTGPRDDAALSALEAGLREQGVGIEDLELVLLTHHHVDHIGLAAEIRRRSGAAIAALDRLADYAAAHAEEVEQDRSFAHRLMRFHGVPDSVVETDEPFWDFLRQGAEPFAADVRLADGDTIAAGRGPRPARGRRHDRGRRPHPRGRRATGPQHDGHALRRSPRGGRAHRR